MKRVFFPLIIIYFLSGLLLAQEEFPQAKGFVNDFAGIITAADREKLARLLTALEEKTTAEVAVVTLESIRPYDIESYAVKLFENWGIGKKGTDNGVLLLIASADRKMRIEVGYGLEGAVPDALAKKIIENDIVPFFKAGDYSAGTLNGTLAIVDLITKEYGTELAETKGIAAARPQRQLPGGGRNFLVFFLFFFIFIVIQIFRGISSGKGKDKRRSSGSYWYGGNYGGGHSGGGFSGGFGGGFSGGGGASGSW